MRFFHRKLPDNTAIHVEDESLEETERNPELLAAEEAVDHMPSSTPLVNPIIEASASPRPRSVGSMEEEGPPRGEG